MVFSHKFFLVFILAVLLSINLSQAQMEPKSEMDNKDVLIKEFLGQLQFVEGRITDLAVAIPASKYTWRPADGVRSVAESCHHITLANYGFAKMAGVKSPEVPKSTADREKFEKSTTDKEQIIKDLTHSFTNLKTAFSDITPVQLDEQVEVFGTKMSRRNFMISTLNHLHEHLGQTIAYARMNGITPPWSK
jgi:uncharacterized damage-inducible protein DinB